MLVEYDFVFHPRPAATEAFFMQSNSKHVLHETGENGIEFRALDKSISNAEFI